MSVLIDPSLDVKHNLLKLIQSTNPNFNFATINHFVIVAGGVLASEETVLIGGESITLDTWIQIRGVTIWGVEGEYTFKYKRCGLSVLKSYPELFACWDFDATIFNTFGTVGGVGAGLMVSSSGNMDTEIRKTGGPYDWMTGSRNPITVTQLLVKNYLSPSKLKLPVAEPDKTKTVTISGNSDILKPRDVSSNNSQPLVKSAKATYDGVEYFAAFDYTKEIVANYLNLHPLALLDERRLCTLMGPLSDSQRVRCQLLKFGEADDWFINSVPSVKFLYKGQYMCYVNLNGGEVALSSSFKTILTQAMIDNSRI